MGCLTGALTRLYILYYTGDGFTDPLWVGATVWKQCLLGVSCGWLFLRKGLEAAMLANAMMVLVTVVLVNPMMSNSAVADWFYQWYNQMLVVVGSWTS